MPGVEVEPVTGPGEAALDEILELYAAVGWTVYAERPDVVRAGLAGASFVATARLAGRLAGLVRVVSDDATVAYVQDVLVHPDAQRHGVGTALLAAVAARYPHVRQHVLLTDDEPGQRAFYESLGYAETRDHGSGTLRAFVRFT